ncbi:MAG: DUF1329 domain-containing protein [Gammaproteobacteria bacterium]|nr:DUF1329 domain-containing protein [Gammaproteobacteria bacterium]
MQSMLVAAVMLATTGAAQAADDVDNAFFPYRGGMPSLGAFKAGDMINQNNVEQARDILDEGMYFMIKQGWTEIAIGPTTSFQLNDAYIQATRDNAGKVSLGEQPGVINGYVAGRPFPAEPDLNDPRSGEKMAWNYRHSVHFGDSGMISPFYWKYRDMKTGKVERQMKLEFRALNWMHRTTKEPIPEYKPNPSGIFRTIYMGVHEPFDVKNTQVLIHRFENDLKRDNAWLYLGFQRRVRRLASGQITDSFLGSDLMIEDFEGYNGRISDMKWSFKGVRNILLPFYNHNEMELTDEFQEPDFKYIDYHGQGGCFPKITWQLRKVYQIEAVPTDPNHPVSKRVMYMDAQTATLPRIVIYDRAGEMWKTWFINETHSDTHLPVNKGKDISVYDGFSMMDLQAMHCTTGQFRTELDPAVNIPRTFTPQYLRAKGR